MDTNIINECKAASLADTITFPEEVKRLSATGVEWYIADLVGLKIHYYGINNEAYTIPLNLAAAKVALPFDAAAVKNIVADAQQQRINYQQFLHRIIAAGCSHYEVFITGQKVIYFGRDGSQHVELFPQVKR